MILIVTNTEDITSDFVVNKLNRLGIPYYRFNTDEFGEKNGISLDFGQNKYKILDFDKQTIIDFYNIKSVYFRRPKLPHINFEGLTQAEHFFVANEVKYFFDGCYKLLEDKFWISQVNAIRQAEIKMYQLKIAHEIGFIIPDSLVANVPKDASAFVERNKNDCIIKPVKSGLLDDKENPRVIYTSILSPAHIQQLERIQVCPTYFQKRQDKIADIRVTVVGKRIFSAQIDSQDYEETSIDWRKGSNTILNYKSIELPTRLNDKCTSLVERLGLKFGAIDLVLNSNGQYVFLEINPNGQWAWIERKLDYDISGEIVRLLKEGKR